MILHGGTEKKGELHGEALDFGFSVRLSFSLRASVQKEKLLER